MEYGRITEAELAGFGAFLRSEERSEGTIENYLRSAGEFAAWLGGPVEAGSGRRCSAGAWPRPR